VEIIRDQNHLPPSNWETIAATGKARAAIRRAVRLQTQQRHFAHGEHLLSMLLEREEMSLDDGEFRQLAEAVGLPGKRELLVAVGEGRVTAAELDDKLLDVKGVKRRRKKIELPVPDKAEGWFALRATDMFRFRVPGNPNAGPEAKAALAELNFNTKCAVSMEGVVPGDRMVAIMQKGQGITIFPIHSEALGELYDSDVAWIDVRWDILGREDDLHPVAMALQSQNKPGGLAQISSVIAHCRANIHNLVMRMESPDFHKITFLLEVRDLGQLTDVLNSLKMQAGVSDVHRATIAEAEQVITLEWKAPAKQKVPA